MNKHSRNVFRVRFCQEDVLSFGFRHYVAVDRCFTSRKAALSFYTNLIKHSDFSDKVPIFSTGFNDGSCLSVGYFADYSIYYFQLTCKTL